MRKVICDRCGGDCPNGHAVLHLFAEHQTSDGQEVGTDQFAPLDLCLGCGDSVRKEFGFRIAQSPHFTGELVDTRLQPIDLSGAAVLTSTGVHSSEVHSSEVDGT